MTNKERESQANWLKIRAHPLSRRTTWTMGIKTIAIWSREAKTTIESTRSSWKPTNTSKVHRTGQRPQAQGSVIDMIWWYIASDMFQKNNSIDIIKHMFANSRHLHSSLAHSDVSLHALRESISSLNKCRRLSEIVSLKVRRRLGRRGNYIHRCVFRIRGGRNLLGGGNSNTIQGKGN